jgi:hypothetical protein
MAKRGFPARGSDTRSLFPEPATESSVPRTVPPPIPDRTVHHDLEPFVELAHDADPQLDDDTTRYVLAHPTVEQYLLAVRTSQLYPLIQDRMGEFLTQSASSNSAKNTHRLHGEHPYGLIMHNAAVYRNALERYEYRDTQANQGKDRELVKGCTPSNILDAVTLHDFAKLDKYVRVPDTLNYAFRGLPSPIPDPAWTMRQLAQAHIQINDNVFFALWYQDPATRENMVPDDIIRILIDADGNATDDVRIPGKHWEYAKRCESCKQNMSLYLPELTIRNTLNRITHEFSGQARFACQTREPKCEKPIPVRNELQNMLDHFGKWIRLQYPHSSPL